MTTAFAYDISPFSSALAGDNASGALVTPLTALSPVDGRYRNALTSLVPYFSELGLQRYRVLVEVEYFICLCEVPLPELAGKGLQPGSPALEGAKESLRKLVTSFRLADGEAIKKIEEKTRHDVKAVEIWLRDQFDTREELTRYGLHECKEFIHFGLTSQDVNNTCIPLALKEAIDNVLLPQLKENVLTPLLELVAQWWDVPLLARTHGQPATPTRLGKEMMVFVERLVAQIQLLKAIPHSAKFGGATGGFNAHAATYPAVDWPAFADSFVEKRLGLARSKFTTQIEHYDNLAALLDTFKRINNILIDFARDMWTYISLEVFGLKTKAGEVGSSAMPHKVNPIDFENAEGNLGVANALFEFMSGKLPISRLQRDLTDSTVLRNLGVAFGHCLQSYVSIGRGLPKLRLREEVAEKDLANNWMVVSEAIQTVLRTKGVENAYNKIKDATRTGDQMGKDTIETVIDSLPVDEELRTRLKAITPFNYAPQLPLNFRDYGARV